MKRLIIVLSLLFLPLAYSALAIQSVAAEDVLEAICTDEDGNEVVPTVDNPATLDNEASSVCAERGNDKNPVSGSDGILIRVSRLFALIIGMASVIIIVYGSIKYITSQGAPEAVASAKHTIIYALIGLVIALLAQGIIVFIINWIQ